MTCEELEFLEEEKVRRILSALAEVVCEVGPGRLTVALIIDRANVSRATFYRLFENSEEAFRSAVRLAILRLRLAIDTNGARGPRRADRVEGVISALIAAVADQPAFAELCLLHAYASPEVRNPIHPALVETLVTSLRGGRDGAPGPPSRPRQTEEFVAYGILWILGDCLRRGDSAALEGLAGELTKLALIFLHPPS